MLDPRMEKWAKALVNYSVTVKPGQTVAIAGGAAAEPLLRAIYREVVRAGGFPIMLPTFSGLAADLLAYGNDAQIEYITPIERLIREQADVVINIQADTNTKSLSGVDPARMSHMRRVRQPLVQTYLQRDADGTLDWTISLYPTDAHAQDADMSTADYEDFVFGACKLTYDDPVAAWKEQAAEQDRLIAWLAGKSNVHFTGPGTDLTLSVAGRTWINADGRKNFPDGEIFTGPVEDSANGHVRFSYPVIEGGREIADIRLKFENGKVIDASASKAEEYLLRTLDTDEGARYIGEFAIGTNFDIQRFTRNILFDEKIGGTVHMALGAGYPASGSTNRSGIHWDMIADLRDGGLIEVDGQPLLKDGKFVV
jgi:aminopeptidase